MPVKLLHKGRGGALVSGHTCHGGGSSAVDMYVRGRSAKHVTLPCCHLCFASERLVEGVEEFLPRIKCLLGGNLAVPLGTVIWKVFGLEEGWCGDVHKEIVQEGEAGAH